MGVTGAIAMPHPDGLSSREGTGSLQRGTAGLESCSRIAKYWQVLNSEHACVCHRECKLHALGLAPANANGEK